VRRTFLAWQVRFDLLVHPFAVANGDLGQSFKKHASFVRKRKSL
jgi:hypothetical protein